MTKLIRNSTAELTEATTSEMEVVQQEGARSVRRMVGFYNLDAVTPNMNNVGKKMKNYLRPVLLRNGRNLLIAG